MTVQSERRDGTVEFDDWVDRMWRALLKKFGGQAPQLAGRAGAGPP